MNSLYRNLNYRLDSRACWSIAGVKGRIGRGKLESYSHNVVAYNVVCRQPSAADLRRVRTKHREVIAWLAADSVELDTTTDIAGWVQIYADVKIVDHFQDADGRRIDGADKMALLDDGRCFAAGVHYH